MPLKTAVLLVFLVVCASVSCRSFAGHSEKSDTYLKYAGFEVPINDIVLLHWSKRDMPLQVYLPSPPEGMFENPAAVLDSVRDGVLDWADVASPSVPSFSFVDSVGEADIPIVWASEPDGAWYIAHCAWDIDGFKRRFGVSRILVTARWASGHVADLHDIYATMLHEMGHALGIRGHSRNPEDIMYKSISREPTSGLSPRDRATLAALYARPNGARLVGGRRAGR